MPVFPGFTGSGGGAKIDHGSFLYPVIDDAEVVNVDKSAAAAHHLLSTLLDGEPFAFLDLPIAAHGTLSAAATEP